MSITVEKSPHALFDETSTNLLNKIVARLEQQAELVKSVHVLANFSVDTDASLKLGQQPIAQGLVVAVKKGYKITEEDQSWFHPSIARGRSVFALNEPLTAAQLKANELTGVNGSVGEYLISRPDEFGCEQLEHRLVVDTSEEDMLLPLYKKWVQQNATAGDVDKQWKRMKFGDTYSVTTKTMQARRDLANKIAPGCKEIMSDTVNAVLSDTEHIYFTNNAILAGGGTDILVKTSALGGYRQYGVTEAKKTFYPATLGTANNYYSWDNMAPRNCARIENTCSWDGELTFNTQVMKPPAIAPKAVRGFEDEYALTHQDTLAMRISHFSPSDAFVDKMDPKDVFKLHPSPEKVSHATDFISAPATMSHPVMNKMMAEMAVIQSKFPDFQIFNPKFMDGNRFKIPRSVYQYIA